LSANPEWVSNIHYILLFDPRSDEYFDPDGCDLKYNESKLLADWLALNKTNTLVMLAGKVTTQPVDDLDHAGIRKKLFPEIRSHALVNGKSIRTQVVVCNYDSMKHEDVWIKLQRQDEPGANYIVDLSGSPGLRSCSKLEPISRQPLHSLKRTHLATLAACIVVTRVSQCFNHARSRYIKTTKASRSIRTRVNPSRRRLGGHLLFSRRPICTL
jgi:hypothetical protein